MKNIIRLGIDIGSTTVKIACLDRPMSPNYNKKNGGNAYV